MAKSSFRSELSRLKKGIRIAWLINFVLVWLIFVAAGIVIGLGTHVTNQYLVQFLIVDAAIGLVIALLVVMGVSAYGRKILIAEPRGGYDRITSGILYNVVEEMAIAAGLPRTPDVYVLHNSGVANAYAVADNKGNAQVVVTDELLALVNREELQGVIGHEIGHIVTGDSQSMTKLVALTSTAAIVAGVATRFMGFGFGGGYSGGRSRRSNNNSGANPIAIVLIVVSFVFLMIAPFLSKVAQSYMSRERESQADATSVRLTRNPTGLARALIKLETGSAQLDPKELQQFAKTIGPMAFLNPMRLNLSLRTHPPTEQRVNALVQMGAQL